MRRTAVTRRVKPQEGIAEKKLLEAQLVTRHRRGILKFTCSLSMTSAPRCNFKFLDTKIMAQKSVICCSRYFNIISILNVDKACQWLLLCVNLCETTKQVLLPQRVSRTAYQIMTNTLPNERASLFRRILKTAQSCFLGSGFFAQRFNLCF